jgi:hypothetical protein
MENHPMSRKQRRKYFVDGKVQTALIAKIIRYWIAGLVSVGGLAVLGWIFVWPGIGAFVSSNAIMANILTVFVVSIFAALLVLPVVVVDLIWFSHRFVGPMVRLRKSMEALAAGDDVAPIRFRDGDFWPEFAEAFNAILARTNGRGAAQTDRVPGKLRQDEEKTLQTV